MTPSRYQAAVFQHVADAVAKRQRRQRFDHVVVEATAGAGKTATCVEACRRIAPTRCIVVAFGHRNADELKQKLPSNAEACTLHSLGNRTWTAALGGRSYRAEVDQTKVERIVKVEIERGAIPKWLKYKVAKLVDLARMHGIVPGSHAEAPGDGLEGAFAVGVGPQHGSAVTQAPNAAQAFSQGDTLVNDVLPLRGLLSDEDDEWLALMERFDVYVQGWPPQQVVRMARDVLRKSIRYGHRVVDYADMLYLPTLAEGVRWRVDAEVLFVDELQDLDHLQRQMVLHLIGSGCVFVGVGDPQQALYSFRGADADSMAKIAAATKAKQLPLSICYRCPTSHLDAARQLVPTIEARPDAEAGVFERYDEDGTLLCDDVGEHGMGCECLEDHAQLKSYAFQPGDLVVCRAKAPLVKAAYYLLKNHVPARILGRDIGRGLVAFVDAMRAPSITELLKKVEAWTCKVVARAAELDDDAGMEEAADKRDVVVAVADGLWQDDADCEDVDVFKSRLESLFGDGEDKSRVVTLSTVHRAKGSESDRVWWLDYHKPDMSANFKREEQRREAKHIIFVALTRSKSELRLIRSESLR